VVPGRDEGPVDDGHLVHPPAPHRGQRQQRAEGVDDAVRGRMRDAEQRPELAHGQVGAPVRGDQQHPVRQVKRPLPTRTPIRDGVPTARRDSRTRRRNWAGFSPVNGWIHSGRAAEITCTETSSTITTRWPAPGVTGRPLERMLPRRFRGSLACAVVTTWMLRRVSAWEPGCRSQHQRYRLPQLR